MVRCINAVRLATISLADEPVILDPDIRRHVERGEDSKILVEAHRCRADHDRGLAFFFSSIEATVSRPDSMSAGKNPQITPLFKRLRQL